MAERDMTTEEQITRNQDERDDARQSLRETLNEVNAKVERVGEDLRPDHLIESHPMAASFVAGALGFLIGATKTSRGIGLVVIAAILGVAVSTQSSREASKRDGRQTTDSY
jgi:hypothetical protein